jgi:hypothetical protein
MRLVQVILAAACVFSATLSFADHDKNGGPCSAYVQTCKADTQVKAATDQKARWEAMGTCISAAAKADATNGPACLAMMAKHKHGPQN